MQICQWVFAAAPGHPALREVAEHIAHTLHITFDQNTNRDTLERTGPGVWTDKLLKYALHNPPAKVGAPNLAVELVQMTVAHQAAGSDA